MDEKIEVVDIINYSGYIPSGLFQLEALKRGKYRVRDVAITGDAPKDFVQIYQYGMASRLNVSNWPKFIAKVGHKWYPTESITEHFLTRLGQRLGFRMADSKLVMGRGQLRFCSRYFLKSGYSLTHGAELFWGYLGDRELVEGIEAANESRNFFSFQFVQDAILHRYPDNSFELLDDFVRMLIFDAIVGNNDRHFYNWGVLEHPEGKLPPKFSPIYDTARAFFWNTPEAKLEALYRSRQQYRRKIADYIKSSRPKIGWDGCQNLNHFELVAKLYECSEQWKSLVRDIKTHTFLREAESLLYGGEFSDLMSDLRKRVVLDSLDARLKYLAI
jgi:hypothetical protein